MRRAAREGSTGPHMRAPAILRVCQRQPLRYLSSLLLPHVDADATKNVEIEVVNLTLYVVGWHVTTISFAFRHGLHGHSSDSGNLATGSDLPLN